MEVDAAFEAIWKKFSDFSFEEKKSSQKEAIRTCEYAHAFTAYAQEVCQAALQNATHVTLNQALLQLTKKYWEFYYVVPKRQHRYQVGERGHRCIHAVFQHFYEVLKRKELQLQPPMLFVPVPPPAQITPPPPLLPNLFVRE
jgi:hypothetical protein